MSRITAQRLCMLCPDRLSATAESSEEAWALMDVRASELGWHRHERVAGQVADVCPPCLRTIRETDSESVSTATNIEGKD